MASRAAEDAVESASQDAEDAVLGEELVIGIERQVPDEEPEREVAPVPTLAAA